MRIILCLNIFICAAIISVPILMPKTDRVAVIASPWGDAGQILSILDRADGALVNSGRRDWIAVVTPQSAMAQPIKTDSDSRFVEKLYQAGAWLVIDGSIAAACLI